MEPKSLAFEFEHRYYLWRIEEARKEAEQQFPYLSMMKSFRVSRTLEAIKKLSDQEQMAALSALIRASEKNLIARLGESMTVEEQTLLNKIRKLEKCPELSAKLALQESNLKKVSRKVLKKNIKDALRRTLDPTFHSGLSFNISLDSKWVLQTHVEIGDSFYYYSHLIYWIDELKNIRLRVGPPTINLPAWYGIYPSGWVFLSDEDAYLYANTIALLCKYFAESCLNLLHRLVLE